MVSLNTYEDLWESDELADVIFLVGEEPDIWRIAAHKLILAKCNPYFHDMFYGSLVAKPTDSKSESNSETDSATHEKESTSRLTRQQTEETIRVSDMRPEIFDQLLRFLYTNKIDEIASIDFALLLYEAANKYKIKEIVVKCIDYLTSEVCEENMFHIYNCFQEYMDEEESLALHAKCAALIDQQPEKVFNTNAFLNVTHEVLSDISSRSTLQLSSELVLFHALLRWSVAECKRRHLEVNDENKRMVLGKTLFNVRFGLLTDDELEEIFKKEEGVLKNDDKKQFLSHPRLGNSLFIFRFTQKIFRTTFVNSENFHSLSFVSDRKVILTSVRFVKDNKDLSNLLSNNLEYFKLTQTNKTIVEMNKPALNIQYPVQSCIIIIDLKHPVYLQPKIKYTISVKFSCSIIINGEVTPVSRWNDGKKVCKIEWKESGKGDNNRTSINAGQLFQLALCIPIKDDQILKPIYSEVGQKMWNVLKSNVNTLKQQVKAFKQK